MTTGPTFLMTSQPAFTYSESRMEIPEHYVDLYSKLTIKTPERRFFKFPVSKVP